MRKEIKALSRSEENAERKIKVICFDLQKVFFCPKSEVGDFFYKRKMACYNFTIFDCTTKKAFCYVWDLTIAGRGAAEISSCVFIYISQEAASGVKELHIYSDSCWAQNKNQMLYTMYYIASQKFGIRIIHRYLVKGHTQMECDSVHARIEKKTKNMTIFMPSEWYGYNASAKVQRPMYTVIRITQVDILSFKELAKSSFTWEKVPISKVHEIILDPATPGKVSFKKKLTDEVTVCQVLVIKPGRPHNWETYKPPQQYEKPIALKVNLVKDLKWMMTQNLIPDRAIEYYRKVTSPDFGVSILPAGEDHIEFPQELPQVPAEVFETNENGGNVDEVDNENENSDNDHSDNYD